ncbi:tetratricopeptide repeat protein [Psychrobacter sp. FBL11]|uniref:Tetratricopeptide repeat protein n=2 Tax=Psychrobacter TaxID=497 RepID=A0ABU9X5U8_9GAMM
MNIIHRTRLTKLNLLSIALIASVMTTGCGKSTKVSQHTISPPTVKQLSSPSPVYLTGATKAESLNESSIEAWMTIAKTNYESKNYSRALRAANEALSIDNQIVEARQIAMLSSVKVMQLNIDAYHNNALMSSHDKATFKDALTSMTTLINTSE